MRSENTIVFVLALLSGHSDVVDAMPGAWARSKAGGEGVGGRDARSLSSAPDEVADEVVVRGESDGKSNQLVARQWPTVPAPPTSYENLAKWFSDTMVIAGGSIGTAFFVYWSGTKIYVAVLRSVGYFSQHTEMECALIYTYRDMYDRR